MTEKCSDPRFADIEENYRVITARIAEAAVRSGRKPEDVTLLAATKTVPAEYINHTISLGLKYIGENRVQELVEKHDALALDGVHCHMIGRLQTNKVKQAVQYAECIQSVDSLRLAAEISRRAAQAGKSMRVLIEVNIGREANKGGILPEMLLDFLHEISSLPSIYVTGLMAIPPADAVKSQLCNYFLQMQQSFIDIGAKKLDNVSMECLSMGMSSDYEDAILCGATMVRVGSSLFGKRIYK